MAGIFFSSRTASQAELKLLNTKGDGDSKKLVPRGIF